MERATQRFAVRFLVALAACAAGVDAGAVDRFALLMGVSDYRAPLARLAGAEHDAVALRDALVERWGFAPGHVRLLRNADADRLGVLNAFTGILSDSKPGDHVFVFFAGHGTSAADRALGRALPHTTGALLPADTLLGAPDLLDRLLIGRRDLRPLLEALDRGDRRVLVVFDACFSGNTVRGAFADALGRPRLPGRGVDLPLRGAAAAAAPVSARAEPYPYRNVVYFAAAAEHETAGDIPADYLKWYPTHDNRPHGAFTDALLRGLHGGLPGLDADRDGAVAYAELFDAVARFMGERGYAQTPQMLPALGSATLARLDAPVFGATPSGLLGAAKPAASAPRAALRFVGFAPDEARRLAESAGVAVAAGAPYALVRTGERVVLVDASADAVADPVPVADAGRLLVQALARLELDALIAGIPRTGLRVGYTGDGLGATRVDGDRVAFRVVVDRPAHLAVVDLDAGGTLRLLHPYDDAEIAAVPANREIELGGSTVVAPYGLDTIGVFAFDAWPNALRPYLGRDLAAGSAEQAEFLRVLRDAKPRAAAATAIRALRAKR
jgi:hypothetical protein